MDIGHKVKKLRLQKGWTQEQLAEISAISIRTIQRIEKGNPASLESLKALAAVFEIKISDFSDAEIDETGLTQQLAKTEKRIEQEWAFWRNVFIGLLICFLLLIINLLTPHKTYWIIYVVAIFVVIWIVKALVLFVFPDSIERWQQKWKQKRRNI